jgi:hypothetical protein
MLSWVMYLAGPFLICGPPLSETFLRVVFGARWSTSNTIAALGLYCYYIPLLGVNGLLEAFARAAADEAEFALMRFLSLVNSFLYISLCLYVLNFTEYGVQGLIVANCASMLMRIGFSCFILRSFIDLERVYPRNLSRFLLLGVASWTFARINLFSCIAAGLTFLGCIVMWDPQIRRFVKRFLKL